MNRIVSCISLACLLAALTAGCAKSVKTGPPSQADHAVSSDELVRSKPPELPAEIDDIQRIPQDVNLFAKFCSKPIDGNGQAEAARQFYQRYFSPWKAASSLDVKDVIEGMTSFADKIWYAENRIKVAPERIKGLLTLAALDRLPSANKPGIAIAPTFLRALPTTRAFYETSDDFPFDQLQYTEIKANEPVRILHESVDGAWLFVETVHASGWVRARNIRVAGEALRQGIMSASQVVIITDFAVIRDEHGRALPQPKLGTLYPLVKEEPDAWVVSAALAGEEDEAELRTARIARKDASRHPLPFTAETATLVGNELLKTPYGWGEVFRDRDCSATTRDFFIPFGIWLPRNSLQQVRSGQTISMNGMTNADKEQLIRERGVPFRTLLHRKGHIMLYVGLLHNKPIILHNTWAIRFKLKDGPEQKFYIGRTVLTTLESGLELSLSRGTILDHLDGMLVLPSLSEATASAMR